MAGLTNYLRNKIVDWLLRDQAFVPPASLYLRLCTSTPTASSVGAEVSGGGYSPLEIESSAAKWAATNAAGSTTVPSSGTSGTTSNNELLNFGTATASWGTVSHWELWDASSGGNRLFYGAITDGTGVPTPRSITTGDPVSFPISALKIVWA